MLKVLVVVAFIFFFAAAVIYDVNLGVFSHMSDEDDFYCHLPIKTEIGDEDDPKERSCTKD